MDTILPNNAQDTASAAPIWPAKLRAATIHLSISATIFAGLLYLVLAIWYPDYFFDVDGGWEGLQIMAAVDLVLGPALTLIVFNPRKKRREIVMDLALIALFQLGALTWGSYMVYQQRPVAVVEYQGTFRALTVDLLGMQHKTLGDLAPFGTERPFIHVIPPRNAEEQSKAMLALFNDGLDPSFQFSAFSAFAPGYAEIAKNGIAIEPLAAKHAGIKHGLDQFLATNAGQTGDYDFYKFSGRYRDALIAFKHDGTWVGSVGFGEPERF